MILDLTDEEVRLATAHFQAAAQTITALSAKTPLTEWELKAYETCLQYIYVSLDNAPALVDHRVSETSGNA